MPLPADPSLVALDGLLHTLRRRYVVKSLLRVVTTAFALDVGLDLALTAVPWKATSAFYFPYFFPLLLAILLLRESGRWRLISFAADLDRTCRTKDRLVHFLDYRSADLDAALRVAQARETLAGVSLQALRDAVQPRCPKALLPLALIFGAMIILRAMSGYEPLGPLQRAVVRVVPGPEQTAVRHGEGPRPESSAAQSQVAGADLTVEEEEMASGEGADPSLSPSDSDQGTDPDQVAAAERPADSPTGTDAESPGRPASLAVDGNTAEPRLPSELESTYATDEVAQPVPARLRDRPVSPPATGRTGGQVLALVPRRSGGGPAGSGVPPVLLAQVAASVPPRYRIFLENYYQLLLTAEGTHDARP